MKAILITTLFFSFLFGKEKKVYSFNDERIDVVIPCAKKDLELLDICIEGVFANVKNLGRVIVVSETRLSNKVEWFSEALYPFTKYQICNAVCKGDEIFTNKMFVSCAKLGWIFQQFLKLYAPLVIPNISSNVLIVDADLVFYRPVEFLDKEFGGLYNPGIEKHDPYFAHMNRLLPGLKREYPLFSGITHHMLFQKTVIEDLFLEIENYHQMPAWQAICKCIDLEEIHGNSMSEYEIYFNYIFSKTDQVKFRPLVWKNSGDFSLKARKQDRKDGFDYVVYHDYKRWKKK